MVAIDELGAIVASAQAKEKAELIALLTQRPKRSPAASFVVASLQFVQLKRRTKTNQDSLKPSCHGRRRP